MGERRVIYLKRRTGVEWKAAEGIDES